MRSTTTGPPSGWQTQTGPHLISLRCHHQIHTSPSRIALHDTFSHSHSARIRWQVEMSRHSASSSRSCIIYCKAARPHTSLSQFVVRFISVIIGPRHLVRALKSAPRHSNRVGLAGRAAGRLLRQYQRAESWRN